MSWLYSMIVAGLMLSNNANPIFEHRLINRASFAPASISRTETERFEQNYPFDANGKVAVSNVNGSITVEAWDKPEIRLEAEKSATDRESLAQVEIKVDARQNFFSVVSDYEKQKNSGWNSRSRLVVKFHLYVPRTAILDEIETVNGSVRVSDFINSTKVSAVNGQVTAVNLRGSANLSTVNGNVEADFDLLQPNGKIAVETVNGNVNLTIPSDSGVTIKAETVNGSISNDFGLPVRKGEYAGKDLYGRIGGGGSRISLSTVNGALAVNRKNDGKNLTPATNLLDGGGNGGEDWDDEIGAGVKPPKINRKNINAEIGKSLADSQREVAEAMKEAEAELKELEKIRPEVAEAVRQSLKSSLAGLSSLNGAELEKQIRQAERVKAEALANLSEINWSNSPLITEKNGKFAVKNSPKVTIDVRNCDVAVRGWDKSEVAYSVKRFSRGAAAPLNFTADGGDDAVSLRMSDADGGNDEENSLRLEVFVPRKSDLKITTDGEIRLENVTGELDLNGVDEAINVRDAGGKLRLSSVDARVRVVNFAGEVNAETVDGSVYLDGKFEKITGKAVDGNFYLMLPETANVNLTSNTEIKSQDLNLVKNGENSWQIGSGGRHYDFAFADGGLLVKNVKLISAD